MLGGLQLHFLIPVNVFLLLCERPTHTEETEWLTQSKLKHRKMVFSNLSVTVILGVTYVKLKNSDITIQTDIVPF